MSQRDDEPEVESSTESPELYELTINGRGFSVQRSIPERVALEVLAVIMGGADTAGTGSPRVHRPLRHKISTSRQSLREFIDETEAKGFPEKIVAIGKYLTENEGQETFTREEVKTRFRAAGERTPANYARDFALAISAGWIAEAHDAPGAFYITQKGTRALEEQFSSEVRRALSQARKGRRRPRKDREEAKT